MFEPAIACPSESWSTLRLRLRLSEERGKKDAAISLPCAQVPRIYLGKKLMGANNLDFFTDVIKNLALLSRNKLKKLVLVITDVATKEVYERWQFDIEADPDVGDSTAKEKDEKRIKQEMSDVLRQITASVAFLPLLENRCSFDVLVYTHRDTVLPEGWADSSECHIDNAEQVQLRSFSTKVQSVHTKVQYKADL